MRSILFTLILFIQAFAFGQFTAATNTTSIKSFLKEKQNGLKTIESPFVETTTNPMLKEPQKGNGQFYFSKPNKIRWENTTSKVTMLMDGKQTKMYEKGKLVTSAVANKVTATIQSMIVGMISGDFLDNGDYTINYLQSSTQYRLELTPKNAKMAKEIKQMNLIFNRSTGILSTMEMVQKSGATVNYQFTDMKVNKEISNTKFTQL